MVSMETLAAEKADRDIDYKELMVLGDTKFQSLVNQGIWGKRTAQGGQILALQTQLKAHQSQQDRLLRRLLHPHLALQTSPLAMASPGMARGLTM